MIRSALILLAGFVGVSWVTGAPYPQGDGWRIIAGWILIAWAVFNVPAFVKGSKGWAKLFLAVVLIAAGLAFVNGNYALLDFMF